LLVRSIVIINTIKALVSTKISITMSAIRNQSGIWISRIIIIALLTESSSSGTSAKLDLPDDDAPSLSTPCCRSNRGGKSLASGQLAESAPNLPLSLSDQSLEAISRGVSGGDGKGLTPAGAVWYRTSTRSDSPPIWCPGATWGRLKAPKRVSSSSQS